VNVRLRPLIAEDASWLDAWLAPVAAGVRFPLDGPPGSTLLGSLGRTRVGYAIGRDGERVGIAVARRGAPSRTAATIELIATPPEHARAGSGMTGARLLEDELRAHGARTIFAPAPEVHGIAVYFWIRLGYRPLQRPEWPCAVPGVAWMRRDLPR